MTSLKLKGNIEKYMKLGLIPSMTRGKQRWRVTYKTGKQNILCSPTIIRKLVIKAIPSPTPTLPQKTAIPLLTPSNPQFP